MATDSIERSHRHSARWLLLLLVAVPLLPEIFIWAVATFAGLKGCQPDQQVACRLGSLVVSDLVDRALWAAGVDIVKSAAWRTYFYLAIGAWLVACCIVLIQGWAGVKSRLLLGTVVALFLALLPFWGPLATVKIFADEGLCKPEAVTGCKLFGGNVDNAYAALQMRDLPFSDDDPLLAVWIFAGFSLLAIAGGVASARRAAKSEQRNF
jgi:hypothetical protein